MSYATMIPSLFGRRDGATPQTAPLPGQVANNAGGYFYAVDDWARLDRFLLLGTEDGTYYVGPLRLTRDNAAAAMRCIAADGPRAVRRIVEVSEAGRAPKNDPALFALALAAASDDAATRREALDALPCVARAGAHVLAFAANVSALRGWGRGLRRGFARWFTTMPTERLALQAVKYAQREGWALRDLLRLAHPLTDAADRRVLIDWMAHPDDAKAIAGAREAFRIVDGVYRARAAATAAETADIVLRFSLPREAVPTQHLDSLEVWDALLVDMPMTAMIRNLGKMTAVGLLAPESAAARYVATRLTDREQLVAARIHPMQLLLALRTYARGRGEAGRLTWSPVAAITEALDDGFHAAFACIEPTGKRLLIGVDVSGSMHGSRCAGSRSLACLEAAAALAMQAVRSERDARVIAFSTETYEAGLSARQRLDDVARLLRSWNGGTDVALPIRYALERRLPVDAFVIVTDNETWAGNEHPVQALARYRREINPAAKLAVLAMAASNGSVIDPGDGLSFGACGFDAAVPQLVSDFIRQ